MKGKAVLCTILYALLCGCLGACGPKALAHTPEQSNSLYVDLEKVEAGTPRLIGYFDFDGGTVRYDVSADDGSGLFVGLYPEDALPDTGVTWERYLQGGILPFVGDEKSIRVSEGVSDLSGRYYLYVGCDGLDLSGVRGTITYQPAIANGQDHPG